jgi:hypothetical protein
MLPFPHTVPHASFIERVSRSLMKRAAYEDDFLRLREGHRTSEADASALRS